MICLPSKKRVCLLFGGNVGRVRIGGVVKKPNPFGPSSSLDVCLPFRALPVKANAKIAAFVLAPWVDLILHILRSANMAQIGNSVVGPVAVCVVNLLRRPFSVLVQPRKPVGVINAAIQPDSHIAALFASGNFPGDCSAPCNGMPKNASLGIVVKKFTQTLRGKIGVSHEALLLLIGQRPACVSAHGGLRYFNAGVAR